MAAPAGSGRDAFEAVGGFDESFFCYCEDVDLGFRIRLAGGRAYQIGAAVFADAGRTTMRTGLPECKPRPSKTAADFKVFCKHEPQGDTKG